MAKFFLFLGLLFFSGIYNSFAQDAVSSGAPAALGGAEGDLSLTLNTGAQLALSAPDYQVTAGDIYTLAYLAGSQAVEYTITVDTSYRIRVSNLAVINAAGKTYNELKTQVEAVVTTNYPMSGVQFVLKTPALFKVWVTGEVQRAREVQVWALSRLSSLSGYTTAYGSLRAVSVASSNGSTRTYDLFEAGRSGDMEQDPYLRPGDVVTFNRVQRSVTVRGEVERPGRYQLLDGEGLKELIEYYGGGFTHLADLGRLELLRYTGSISLSGDKVFLDEGDVAENYELWDHDTVSVPQVMGLRPVVFVEGAVGVEEGVEVTASTRLTIPFEKGESYPALVRRNRSWFTAVSDTENAYIVRAGERIPVNLNPMLYDSMYHSEIVIVENDTLVIPFRQYFITVAGSVVNPGRYPYIPDRAWDYYIALAGGFISDRNAFQKVTILNINGKKLRKTDVITPESVITASTNNGLYYFNQIAPIVTTTASLVLSFISIYTMMTR